MYFVLTPDIHIPAVPRIVESSPSVASYPGDSPVGIHTTFDPSVHKGRAAVHTAASEKLFGHSN